MKEARREVIRQDVESIRSILKGGISADRQL